MQPVASTDSCVCDAPVVSEPVPPLRVGLVGVGRWGLNLVRAFEATGAARLVLAHDVDPTRAALLTTGARWARTIAELLDGGVEAVVIATPPRLHARLTFAALAAGKDVFVEKPGALSVRDAEAVIESASLERRRVMVGLVVHYDPVIEALTEWVRRGRLGRLQRLWAERGSWRPHSSDHPLWWSLAPHDVSLALALGHAVRTVAVSDDAVPGAALRASLVLDGGVEMSLHLSSGARLRRFVAWGDEAVAVFDDSAQPQLRLYERAALRQRDLRAERPVGPPVDALERPPGEPLVVEAMDFTEGVRTSRPFRVEAPHALEVVRVLAAGEASLVRRCEQVVRGPAPLPAASVRRQAC